MVWVRLPVYFYEQKETFYFSQAVPSDLRHPFNKKKVEVSPPHQNAPDHYYQPTGSKANHALTLAIRRLDKAREHP